MYSIVVTAGPSLDESTHQCVHVNSETYVPISGPDFEGQVAVRVKDFSGLAPDGLEPIPQSKYFDDAQDVTFSIEASGIYKSPEELKADDLMFGIVFRQSIAERLPSTYPLVVKAFQWFNPNIEFQLEGENPTMLAPLVTIMSRITCTSPPPSGKFSDQSTPATSRVVPSELEEDISMIINGQEHGSRVAGAFPQDGHLVKSMLPVTSDLEGPQESSWGGWFGSSKVSRPQARQKWFSDKEVRQETVLRGNDYVITTDLQNGFMDFKDMSLRMSGLPWPIRLGPYMKGRPVQYCCVSRDRKKLYWSVIFTIVEGPDEDDAEEK
ncbi:hypothetical protein DL93DRAFT_2223608 [Clavulina sp. PMI_390]|nr:hypothetical protein DL93DRAFT_2223608 [Clavulina sp. PMI_390]